ncbi:FAD-dependent oxidoreductase [Pradoshia sp.]
MTKSYNAIIIGFGKGGKTLAADLAKRNWKVAVIEKSAEMYGGTCINIGCIPTKSLVHQSQKRISNMDDTESNTYFLNSIEEKNKLVSMLRSKNYDNLDSKETITLYNGTASFISESEIEIETADGKETITGERIFINTGATTIMPPIKGLKDSQFVHDSTSIMELSQLPKNLVIIGGGYIGLEFASIYHNFGSNVTIIEAGDTFLPREDRDIADLVKQSLEEKGINIILNASVTAISDNEKEAAITYELEGEQKQLNTECILVAVGRKPNTDGLQLEKAGVEVDKRGAVIVDDKLETTTKNIWALGDVKGGLQFTYISLDDYRIIRDQLFENGTRKTTDRKNVPYSVFIDPPLSRIGLSEEEAKQKGYDISVAKLPVAAIPRARVIQETTGLMKAIVDRQTGQILGCTLFCAESSEIINIVALAMKTGQDYTFLRDHIFTHPSMAEALNDLFSAI